MKQSGWPTTSRHARGYGAEWQKLRVLVLKRDAGLCQCDECQGGKLRITVANEVHHIIPKARGGTDDMSNLQSVNKECHARLTAAEQGRTLQPKAKIGADGWPI